MIASKKEWQAVVAVARATATNHVLVDAGRLLVEGDEGSETVTLTASTKKGNIVAHNIDDIDRLLRRPVKDGGYPAGPINSQDFPRFEWWGDPSVRRLALGSAGDTWPSDVLLPALKGTYGLRCHDRAGYATDVEGRRFFTFALPNGPNPSFAASCGVLVPVLGAADKGSRSLFCERGILVDRWAIEGGPVTSYGRKRDLRLACSSPRRGAGVSFDREAVEVAVKAFKLSNSMAVLDKNPRANVLVFGPGRVFADADHHQFADWHSHSPWFAVGHADIKWLLSIPGWDRLDVDGNGHLLGVWTPEYSAVVAGHAPAQKPARTPPPVPAKQHGAEAKVAYTLAGGFDNKYSPGNGIVPAIGELVPA